MCGTFSSCFLNAQDTFWTFFDNIFRETHEELTDLQESFSKMQISFQSNSNFNEEAEQEMLVVLDTEDIY